MSAVTEPIFNPDTIVTHAGDWCDYRKYAYPPNQCECKNDYDWFIRHDFAFCMDDNGDIIAEVWRQGADFKWVAYSTWTMVEESERKNENERKIVDTTFIVKVSTRGRQGYIKYGTYGTVKDVTTIAEGTASTPEKAAQDALDAWGNDKMSKYEPPESF
jgi:hypothetical protein